MNWKPSLTVCALLLAACAHDSPSTPPAVQSTAQLLNTYWKLVQLGDQVVSSPAGTREIHLVLHSENQRVAGFSGCNQMMGSYALEGSTIRFEQMGGTLMACVPEREIERQFLAVFPEVVPWEITGETLRLIGAEGQTLATFESRYLR